MTPIRCTLRHMARQLYLPDDDYLKKIGLVVYLVSSLEGLVLLDLPRLEAAVPSNLNIETLVNRTTTKVGLDLLKYAPECSRLDVEVYLAASGRALLEGGAPAKCLVACSFRG